MLERIEAKVVPQGECLVWTGRLDQYGYGRLHHSKTETALVHRLAWIERHGPIPEGLHVMHLCDNPPCVSNAHLVLGTPAANLADMRAKGRRPIKTHCYRGHEREPGRRNCRKCDVIRQREYQQRKALA